jgi:CRISPR/Cas system-associated exonuclease Cas4 (RecB family)
MSDRIRASAHPTWTPVFDIGNLIHRVLSQAPTLILEDKTWNDTFNQELKQLQSCSPDMIQRAVAAIDIGWTNVKTSIDEGLVITTEVPMERTLPSGITITGTADRIDESKKLLRIIDYKSGYLVPTKQDMLGDMQLLTYAFLCQDRASLSQTIEVCLFSLGRGIIQALEVPTEIEAIIEDIIDTRAQMMLNDTEHKPNPSSLCGYCDYRYQCKFWDELSTELDIPETIDEKVKLLEKIMSLNKGLDAISDGLRDSILNYMKEEDISEISINGRDCRIIQSVAQKGDKVTISRPYIKIN